MSSLVRRSSRHSLIGSLKERIRARPPPGPDGFAVGGPLADRARTIPVYNARSHVFPSQTSFTNLQSMARAPVLQTIVMHN